MDRTAIFMADGCEEIEALTVVDILRRAEIPIDMISIHPRRRIIGSHGIAFDADCTAEEAALSRYAAVILPGGMPGTTNLMESPYVRATVEEFDAAGKLVAAICAAPTVLGACGVLKGRNAICYPGLEEKLTGAVIRKEEVVADGHIITSRGMGTAIPFALAIVAYYLGQETADTLAEKIVFRQ